MLIMLCFFFFQAEDGIRDVAVTGVQTCALPISYCAASPQASHRACPALGLATKELYAKTCALDRKSTRLNSSHGYISYAVFCLKKKKSIYYISPTPHCCTQDS